MINKNYKKLYVKLNKEIKHRNEWIAYRNNRLQENEKEYGKILIEDLEELLTCLNKQELEMMEYSYGINGEKLSGEEIALKYNMSISQFNNLKERLINRIINNKSREYTQNYIKNFGLALQEYGSPSHEETENFLNDLTDHELKIINSYLGVNTEKLTLKEIASKYKVTGQSVSRNLMVIFKKMADMIPSKHSKDEILANLQALKETQASSKDSYVLVEYYERLAKEYN